MKLTTPFLIAALLVTACSSKINQPSDSAESGDSFKNSFYLRASLETAEETGLPFLWEEGDILYAYDSHTLSCNGKTSFENGIGKESAMLVLGTDFDTDAELRLISVKDADWKLPSVQTQVSSEGKVWFPYSYAYTGTAAFTGKNLPQLSVKVPMALLRIIFDASDATFDGALIKSAAFSCEGASLSGPFSLDFDNCTVTPSQNGSSSVKVVPEKGIPIVDGKAEIWMAVLPSDLSGRQCSLSLEFSGKTAPADQTCSFPGRNISGSRVHSLRIRPDESVITPADRSKQEFTYSPVRYKKTMETASFTTSLSAGTVTVDGMNWMDRYNANTLDRWGGYEGVKPDAVTSSNPEGYWRTGKYKGHNVMVNPDGNVTILHGINGCNPDRLRPQSQPESQIEYDKRFSSTMEWAEFANKALTDFGFNFISMGSSRIRDMRNTITEEVQSTVRNHYGNARISQVDMVAFLRTFSWDYYSIAKTSGPSTTGTEASVFTLLYDPDWLSYIDALAKDATDLYKDDEYFIGWYTDNELQFRWADSRPGISLKDWIALDTSQGKARCYAYAKKHAEDFIRNNYGVEPAAANITDGMESAFLTDVAEYYYKTVTDAIRKYDRNHLLLGSRLHGKPMGLKEVTLACAKYNDVISTNIYSVWEPDPSYYTSKVEAWVGDKPCMITEFYTRNEKEKFNGTPYANTGEGGGWIVTSQEDRGRYYENFTRKAITFKNIVGWQWFQMFDDYLINYGWNNKGIISPDFQYYGCYQRMKRLHWNIYQILDYYFADGKGAGAKNFENAEWE